ncbi:hypothetical protein MTP04_23020 [Lysinibacillus sp. PLM2]|nr:hypothetical protein MTP04_23020 [Lysinibacillus sp. PLM2]
MNQENNEFTTLGQESEENVLSKLPEIFQLLKEGKIKPTNDVLDIISKFPTESTPFILEILGENEEQINLQIWTLKEVVPRLPFFVKIALTDEIERMVNKPSPHEKEQKLDSIAQEALNSIL